MPKHFPGSSKNINSFLSPARWYSRVVRAILLWVLHAKYLWGIYTYGARAEKKVVYITRLSLVSNNKHYYIKYTRARRQMTSLTYELNPRGIEDEIVFCAPNERERICSSRGQIFLMCFLMKKRIYLPEDEKKQNHETVCAALRIFQLRWVRRKVCGFLAIQISYIFNASHFNSFMVIGNK